MEKVLSFIVKGQNISLRNPDDKMVSGSIGYLKAQFDFDEAWIYKDNEGNEYPLVIKILYTSRGKTIEEDFSLYSQGENFVPPQVLNSPGFSVCCYGEYVDISAGRVLKRLPTETIFIGLKPSGPIEGNSPSDALAKADAYALAIECSRNIEIIKNHLGI